MDNKKIIIFLIIFLIASLFYLAYIEQSRRGEGNFWVLYFADPKGDNLSFVIDNYSDKNNFHWEVLIDKNKVTEKDAVISKGNKKIIDLVELKIENKKITIIVSDGENKKEIYKNINR